MSAPKKRPTFLRLVGGTETSVAVPSARRTCPRGPNSRVQKAKEDSDPIFFAIARHSAALASYNFAVDNDEHGDDLHDDMVLMSRIMVLTEPTTRRGLIALAKYLEEQFDIEADSAGCTSMGDKIGGKLWPRVFMRTLRRALSHMALELGK
jgi:hypothetical protein